jgi:predicted flavoprotein YhiN
MGRFVENALAKSSQSINKGTFQVNGKSTFKEEFVTAGGIDLKEINFKTMESNMKTSILLEKL